MAQALQHRHLDPRTVFDNVCLEDEQTAAEIGFGRLSNRMKQVFVDRMV